MRLAISGFVDPTLFYVVYTKISPQDLYLGNRNGRLEAGRRFLVFSCFEVL